MSRSAKRMLMKWMSIECNESASNWINRVEVTKGKAAALLRLNEVGKAASRKQAAMTFIPPAIQLIEWGRMKKRGAQAWRQRNQLI